MKKKQNSSLISGQETYLTEKEKQDAFFKKVIRNALVAVLGIALIVVGYMLLRYEFYDGYRAAFKNAYTGETGTEFTPLTDSENSVPGMKLAAENETLKLYTDPKTGEVAVFDRRNGNIFRSNPENADKDPVANKTNKAYLKSQIMIDYFNANRNAGSYDSWSMSTDRGQMTCESIENGVRFVYGLGEITEIKYYVPFFLNQEWYDAVKEKATEKDAKNLARLYPSQNEAGLWVLTEMARNDNSKKKKADAALQQAGFTEADYWEMQELGGVETAETMFFTVTVDYRLNGDGLDVSIPTDRIEEKGGGKINRIQLLRFMAAAGTDENGYFVVPDGCGALIRFNNGKTTVPVYNQYVYGLDPLSADYTVMQNSENSPFPFYGICRENSTVLVSVERGASLCGFTADVAGRTNSWNVCQPVFVVRGSENLSMFGVDGTSADVPVIENDLVQENLTVRYAFPDETYTGYNGVAAYWRERMIREGQLTPNEEEKDIPFFCDVVGGVKTTKHALGFKYLAIEPMTTFAETGDMADELTQLGITRPVINLQGWFNGGYYHDTPGSVWVLNELGGKKALKALEESISAVGGKLFADVAFQKVSYIAKHYLPDLESSRYYGAGYSVRLGQVNPVTLRQTSSLGYDETVYDLLSPKFLPRYVEDYLKSFVGTTGAGISLRDLGNELHSDKRRTNMISREQAKDIVTEALDSLKKTGRELMVTGGNDYALAQADYVIDVPMQATMFHIVDEEIPLYQMIVHGSVEYAGTQMNLNSADTRDRLLKAVEYGASCHYMFTEQDATQMKYTGMNRYYSTAFDLWKEKAAESWAFLNGALAPVSGAFMTGHEKLSNDLVRVTYSNGISIWVNYGNEDAVVDGITVPAKSYTLGGGTV